MTRLMLALLTVLWLQASSVFANSSDNPQVELLVVEQEGCAYCERFRREIANIYPKTEEGKQAPLHWLEQGAAWPPPYSSLASTNVTPTFILVRDGKEIDRLYGYAGDEHFWFLLGQMLARLDEPR